MELHIKQPNIVVEGVEPNLFVSDKPSLTVPHQATSLRELHDRFMRGQMVWTPPVDNGLDLDPNFENDGFFELPDDKLIAESERAALAEQVAAVQKSSKKTPKPADAPIGEKPTSDEGSEASKASE